MDLARATSALAYGALVKAFDTGQNLELEHSLDCILPFDEGCTPMFLATRWDSELQLRYALADKAFRYPPLEKFKPIGTFEALKALRKSRDALMPLSLYVHLPFCKSRCHHCQRHNTVLTDQASIDQYLNAVTQEISLTSQHLDPRQHVERLHIGGGTPLLLSPQQLRLLMNALEQHFTLLEHAGDYSIEVDPRFTSWPTIGLLRELGFNRLQLRVHDLAKPVQQAINHQTTLNEVRAAIDAARTLQFNCVSLELTYGLPNQTPESFAQTLHQILTLAPDRITLKPYLPNAAMSPYQGIATDIPPINHQLEIRRQSLERLTNEGYIHLGLEHFVLAYDDLLMAQDDGKLRFDLNGYSSYSPCDALGFGTNAISYVQGLYTRNTLNLTEYQERLGKRDLPKTNGLTTTLDDQLRAFIIEQLQCQQRLDIHTLEQTFAIHFEEYFSSISQTLKRMAQEQIVMWENQELRILELGRSLIGPVCNLFAHPKM